MRRNGPVIHSVVLELLAPWGAETVYPDDAGIARYTANPDGFAAAHFGLSESDYFEWLDTNGAPRCGHPTKSGKPCGIQVSRM